MENKCNNIKMIEVVSIADERGSNAKIYSKNEWGKLGIQFDPLEILNIHSEKNVLRGLHYQRKFGQSKMLYCRSGEIYLVAVDIDEGSECYGKWYSYKLDNPNKIIFVPKTYAVGTLAIEESDFVCMCGENQYMPEYNAGVIWNDENIGIEWPGLSDNYVISINDSKLPLLRMER